MDIMAIVAGGLTLLLGVSVIWGRVEKVKNAQIKIALAFTTTAEALEDKKLTQEELQKVVKNAKEAGQAVLAIFKK